MVESFLFGETEAMSCQRAWTYHGNAPWDAEVHLHSMGKREVGLFPSDQ